MGGLLGLYLLMARSPLHSTFLIFCFPIKLSTVGVRRRGRSNQRSRLYHAKLPNKIGKYQVQFNSRKSANSPPPKAEEHNSSASKWKSSINSNWPPADWKTAPGYNSVTAFASRKPGSSSSRIIQEDFAGKNLEEANTSQTGIIEFDIEVDATAISERAVLHEAVTLESLCNSLPNLVASSMNTTVDSVGLDIRCLFPSNGGERDEAAQQALLTGRMGELVAFKYFTGKVGDVFVKWVNETYETGLPYDIILGGDESSREYVEVKATKSARKNWFLISMREWQFAVEKGESFGIAHVDLTKDNMARVTIYKNPARLCQLGNLKLAMMVPK